MINTGFLEYNEAQNRIDSEHFLQDNSESHIYTNHSE